ncbi:hypothetical protein D3877_10165 [Azospirillum cavernae]|uniref:Uncharacterized protein n=1 Tax=Azospirillum cavernae TaxID=2320860 RepID=A0A418W476_9PROT|nr:hypothetical protein [Azospirillum cavernae]RJF84833.1 hypothetical protein D3877_10165 [Azospirillum cavernae]
MIAIKSTPATDSTAIFLDRPPEPPATASPAGEESGLAQWHKEDAEKAERAAAQTLLPMLRVRLLETARMHRDCAELAREGA